MAEAQLLTRGLIKETFKRDRTLPPDWEKRMAAAFGATPKVTYYDNHVVVDNETGKVRVEGET